MSKVEYLSYLQQRLHELEARMKTDKDRVADGSAREKVAASGDLALVEKRLEETKQKLQRLEAEPGSSWEDLKTEFEEELDHIKAAFERWAEKHE